MVNYALVIISQKLRHFLLEIGPLGIIRDVGRRIQCRTQDGDSPQSFPRRIKSHIKDNLFKGPNLIIINKRLEILIRPSLNYGKNPDIKSLFMTAPSRRGLTAGFSIFGLVEASGKGDVSEGGHKRHVIEVDIRNFKEVVLDSKKDVLILFYTPWCGHCKRILPIFEKLGEVFKDEDNLLIAKMDASKSQPPHPFHIPYYPSVYWVPHDHKKNPVFYDGRLFLDPLVSFVYMSSSFIRDRKLLDRFKKKA